MPIVFPELIGTVNLFADGIYAVTRSTPSTYVDGRLVLGTTSVINVPGCLQPLTGRDLQRLPEGRRGEESIKILTEIELFTENEDLKQRADRLTFDGWEWEVSNVERWGRMAGYWRCILTKVKATS